MTTFVQSTLPSSAAWISVAYGNGRFVAIANSSDSAAAGVPLSAVFYGERPIPSPAYDASVFVLTKPHQIEVLTD